VRAGGPSAPASPGSSGPMLAESLLLSLAGAVSAATSLRRAASATLVHLIPANLPQAHCIIASMVRVLGFSRIL